MPPWGLLRRKWVSGQPQGRDLQGLVTLGSKLRSPSEHPIAQLTFLFPLA